MHQSFYGNLPFLFNLIFNTSTNRLVAEIHFVVLHLKLHSLGHSQEHIIHLQK